VCCPRVLRRISVPPTVLFRGLISQKKVTREKRPGDDGSRTVCHQPDEPYEVISLYGWLNRCSACFRFTWRSRGSTFSERMLCGLWLLNPDLVLRVPVENMNRDSFQHFRPPHQLIIPRLNSVNPPAPQPKRPGRTKTGPRPRLSPPPESHPNYYAKHSPIYSN